MRPLKVFYLPLQGCKQLMKKAGTLVLAELQDSASSGEKIIETGIGGLRCGHLIHVISELYHILMRDPLSGWLKDD